MKIQSDFIVKNPFSPFCTGTAILSCMAVLLCVVSGIAQNSCSTSGTAQSGSGDLSMSGGTDYYVDKNTTWSGNLSGSNANVLRINGSCSGSQASWTGGITESWFPNNSDFRIAVYGSINTSTTWAITNNRTWYDTIYASGSETLGALTVSGNGPNYIVNYGTLTINGNLNNTGLSLQIKNMSGGTIHITGNLSGANTGIDNSGTFTVDGSYTYSSSSASFVFVNNAGGIFNAGSISSSSNQTLTNNGRMNVTGNWTSNSTLIVNNNYLIIGGTFSGNSNMTWGTTCYIKVNTWNSNGNITGPGSGCAAIDVSGSWSYSGTVGAGNSSRVYMCYRPSPGSSPGGALNSTHLTCSGCAPLPIELMEFSVQNIGSKSLIKWVTATETNNDYFTIERSADANNFEIVATVKGAGNSSNKLSYTSVDESPLPGTSYYRLKQTDFDGKFTYSKLVPVENTNVVTSLIYPNPSSGGSINIKVNGVEEREVLVVLYNSLGETAYSKLLINDGGNGILTATIEPESSLTPGVYYIVATSKNELFRKMLVVSGQK